MFSKNSCRIVIMFGCGWFLFPCFGRFSENNIVDCLTHLNKVIGFRNLEINHSIRRSFSCSCYHFDQFFNGCILCYSKWSKVFITSFFPVYFHFEGLMFRSNRISTGLLARGKEISLHIRSKSRQTYPSSIRWISGTSQYSITK